MIHLSSVLIYSCVNIAQINIHQFLFNAFFNIFKHTITQQEMLKIAVLNTWLFIFENDEMSFSYIFPINPLNHLILSEFVLIKDSSDVFYYKNRLFEWSNGSFYDIRPSYDWSVMTMTELIKFSVNNASNLISFHWFNGLLFFVLFRQLKT